jgi:hypothetical protein
MADRIRPAAHRCDAAIAASRADDGLDEEDADPSTGIVPDIYEHG